MSFNALMDGNHLKSHQKDFLLHAPFLIADSAFLLPCENMRAGAFFVRSEFLHARKFYRFWVS